MKPIKFITGLFCIALAVLPACSKQDGQKVARQNDARPVSVVAATNVAWDRTVSIVGTLFPKDEATIAAQVEGTVEKTLVDFGDRVKSE